MSRLETPTSAGFQKEYLKRFSGRREAATVEEIATVYAALMGVIDVFLSTHRALISLPLTHEQRDIIHGATEDMTTVIQSVGEGISKLDARVDGK